MGNLKFVGDSGKVKIGDAGLEALVEVMPSAPAQCNSAPPVILPPPPSGPAQPQTSVWIVNSFNKTVKAGDKYIVALGMVMQGMPGSPMWPGMMLPGASTVTINGVPANVLNDTAMIFPTGGSASFNSSGQ